MMTPQDDSAQNPESKGLRTSLLLHMLHQHPARRARRTPSRKSTQQPPFLILLLLSIFPFLPMLTTMPTRTMLIMSIRWWGAITPLRLRRTTVATMLWGCPVLTLLAVGLLLPVLSLLTVLVVTILALWWPPAI